MGGPAGNRGGRAWRRRSDLGGLMRGRPGCVDGGMPSSIISRMIKIVGLLVLSGVAGCGPTRTSSPPGLAGVLELDTWTLGFELGGKLASVAVDEGDSVENGQLLAALDPTLAELTLQQRE